MNEIAKENFQDSSLYSRKFFLERGSPDPTFDPRSAYVFESKEREWLSDFHEKSIQHDFMKYQYGLGEKEWRAKAKNGCFGYHENGLPKDSEMYCAKKILKFEKEHNDRIKNDIYYRKWYHHMGMAIKNYNNGYYSYVNEEGLLIRRGQ